MEEDAGFLSVRVQHERTDIKKTSGKLSKIFYNLSQMSYYIKTYLVSWRNEKYQTINICDEHRHKIQDRSK